MTKFNLSVTIIDYDEMEELCFCNVEYDKKFQNQLEIMQMQYLAKATKWHDWEPQEYTMIFDRKHLDHLIQDNKDWFTIRKVCAEALIDCNCYYEQALYGLH